MARFRLREPVHIETHHGTHGPIEEYFEAGEVVPRSEQEEAALLHLTQLGFAEQLADEEPRPHVESEAVTDAPE